MDCLTKGGRRLGSVALVAILIMAVLPQWSQALELEEVAKISPGAQVLLRLTTAQPIDQEFLRSLGKLPMRPVNQNRRADIGDTSIVVSGMAGAAIEAQQAPGITAVEWIKQYPVAGHYFVHFEYVGEEVQREMTFTVSVPGSAPGRTRTSVEIFCQPDVEPTLASDSTGNEFATITLSEVQPGQIVNFDFFVTYDYDTEQILLRSANFLPSTPMPESWPSDVELFLQPGFHIQSESPAIVAAAAEIRAQHPQGLDELINAVKAYVGKHMRYNNEKRDKYFGGKYVYSDAWEMWQGAEETLQCGTGCCPDSAELKVALLRVLGVPARTAVHSGHLYAEIYVPDIGWVTDGPMFSIPVLRSPDADNHAYFEWSPQVPVRCASWGGKTVPFGRLRPGMVIVQ